MGNATALLLVAENAAACAYNASQPRDPFDEDRFEVLAVCARRLVDAVDDEGLRDAVWHALCGA